MPFKIHNHQQAHFITFAVVDWVDVFTRPVYKQIVVESLTFCQKEKGLYIHDWCIMTNYIHLVVSAKEGYNLSEILRDFKKYTAKQILRDLESNPKESREEHGCYGCLKKPGLPIQRIKCISFGGRIIAQWK